MREILVFSCALGSGVIAGFFFAFSFGVMKALGKLPPAQGVAAMQSINVAVINPVFLGVFLGTGIACLVALIGTLLRWRVPGGGYLIAGSLLYIVGSFVVTMVFNVPRNNALAALTPGTPQADALWVNYLSTWTAWNHVRMLASLAAMALFILGYRARG
jgi:uncharacterized membrane protein